MIIGILHEDEDEVEGKQREREKKYMIFNATNIGNFYSQKNQIPQDII